MIDYSPIKFAIESVSSSESIASISMAAFDGHEPEYRTLATTKKVISTFKLMIGKFLDKYDKLHNNGDLRLVEYDPGFKPDPHFIEYIKVKGSHFESLITSVPNPSDTLIMNPDETKFVTRLKFYVLLITYKGKRILIFKRYSKAKELGHGGGFLVSWIGNQYDKVSDSVFSFDEYFDCMVVENVLYSFNKSNTEIIFHYFEQLKDSAYTTIDKIAVHIPIANLDQFKRDCATHLHKLTKLRNIAQKGYLPKLDIEMIKRIIAKFHLQIRIALVNGKEMLEHDPNDKWALLNLLDDAYLSSDLTGYNYEVNSKLPI